MAAIRQSAKPRLWERWKRAKKKQGDGGVGFIGVEKLELIEKSQEAALFGGISSARHKFGSGVPVRCALASEKKLRHVGNGFEVIVYGIDEDRGIDDRFSHCGLGTSFESG